MATASSPQLTDWNQIYNGVWHAVGASTVHFIDGSPAMQRVTALKIELQAPGIDFRTTPAATAGAGNGVTVAQTIEQFMNETGVNLAINGNLGAIPNGNYTAGTVQISGLSVDQGQIVCDPRKPPLNPTSASPADGADVPDNTYLGCTALMIYGRPGTGGQAGNFTAEIAAANYAEPFETENLYAAVAGSRPIGEDSKSQNAKRVTPRPQGTPPIPFLIKDGEFGGHDKTDKFGNDTFIAGRTGVGVDKEGQTLFLVVVEGLENFNTGNGGYGATFSDIAHWMMAVGAYDAVSLDGGGSSVMAKLDQSSKAIVPLNIQYGNESTPGYPRLVCNYFGIVAAPTP